MALFPRSCSSGLAYRIHGRRRQPVLGRQEEFRFKIYPNLISSVATNDASYGPASYKTNALGYDRLPMYSWREFERVWLTTMHGARVDLYHLRRPPIR